MAGLALDGAIDLYLEHVKIEKGLAPNTVAAYSRDLAKFRDFCERRHVDDAGLVDERVVVDFLLALTTRHLALRSQARNLVALRGLFKHLRAERYIEKDPTQEVELPRLGRALPEVLSLDEVEALLGRRIRARRAGCATQP